MAQIGPSDVDENVNDFVIGYQTRRVGRFVSLAGTICYVAFALFLSGGLLRWKVRSRYNVSEMKKTWAIAKTIFLIKTSRAQIQN